LPLCKILKKRVQSEPTALTGAAALAACPEIGTTTNNIGFTSITLQQRQKLLALLLLRLLALAVSTTSRYV